MRRAHWSDRVEVGVGAAGVEGLVGPHHRHQVGGVRQVDDVVRVARQHVHGLDPVAAYLVLQHLVGALLAELDQAVAGDHDEQLPLGVVPVLTLGYARPGDVDRHLAAAGRAQQFGERAALVDVHPQLELDLVSRQIAQVGGVELLGEGSCRNLRHQQRPGLSLELMQQVHDVAQCRLVCDGNGAVAAARSQDGLDAVELASVLVTGQGGDHLVDKVVDVEQLQLHGRVVDPDGEVVGDVAAERRDGGVVVGTAPLAEQVRETVHQHLGAGLAAVVEEELLASQLGLAVITLAVAAYERGLDGAGQHDGAGVAVLLKRVQQGGGEAEVSLHELLLVLGAVDARQVEDEVGAGAPVVELLRGGVKVVLEHLVHPDGVVTCLALPDVVELGTEVPAHEPLCACNQYPHSLSLTRCGFRVRCLRG